MSALSCPGCGHDMNELKSPDVTIDECPDCGGTWLDPGELNALATGLAGDIEFCAAEHQIHDAAAPERNCPRCDQQPLATVTLLNFSDIVFDHCQVCRGFYLDRGEVEAMNEELRSISRATGGDEFRGEIGGQLVRVDRDTVTRISQDPLGLSYAPVEEQTLSITVFFAEPMGLNLRICAESLSSKLAKALRLFAPQDWQFDDKEFDRAFLVQGDDEAGIKAVLGDVVRKRLVQLRQDAPKVYSRPGSVEVLDNRVVYVEGPYSVVDDSPYAAGLTYDAEQDPVGIVTALRRIARLIDEARS